LDVSSAKGKLCRNFVDADTCENIEGAECGQQRGLKFEWKQQQQKLPSTPLIVEADEVQQPSRQVEVAVSEEEMSGAITSKMIYRHKYGPEGELTRYKSRLVARGFQQTKGRTMMSLFLLQEKDEILMLLVYVDDILLFSASTALLDSAEQMLEMQFKCSKMGEVKYYLGMHVERDVERVC
ncbi:hypothetical protein CLOM_g11856, partial [Closterium sp. NIES-68]